MAAIDNRFGVAATLLKSASTAPRHRKCGPVEGKADAGVHDDDKAERSEVDVGKEHSGVDFTHLLIGPVFPAPVEGTGVVVATQHYSHPLLLCDLEHDPRGTHDGHGQHPYDEDYELRGADGQFLPERVDDAAEPGNKAD